MATLLDLQTDTLELSNTVQAQCSLDRIKNRINFYYDELVAFVWTVDNSWVFDEGVNTLPTATTDLEKDQDNYQLPSTARQILRVTILDNTGTQQKLKPLSDKQMPKREQEGVPTGYKLVGRSIILTPTPNYAKTAGLIIETSKSVTALAAGGDEPKVDREFHRYLSYGATKDWYFSKSNITKKREMEREMDKMKITIKDFYTNRHKDYSPARITRKHENYL